VTSDAPTATEPLSRSDRRRAKRVDDILRVATRLLAERGYAATNLDEIAEMLDLSKASLYHYFPSKEHLILACLDRIGDETNQHLSAVAGSAAPPRDRLHAAVRAQVLVRRCSFMISACPRLSRRVCGRWSNSMTRSSGPSSMKGYGPESCTWPIRPWPGC
jgi:AcrR family transcriptional regulator